MHSCACPPTLDQRRRPWTRPLQPWTSGPPATRPPQRPHQQPPQHLRGNQILMLCQPRVKTPTRTHHNIMAVVPTPPKCCPSRVCSDTCPKSAALPCPALPSCSPQKEALACHPLQPPPALRPSNTPRHPTPTTLQSHPSPHPSPYPSRNPSPPPPLTHRGTWGTWGCAAAPPYESQASPLPVTQCPSPGKQTP